MLTSVCRTPCSVLDFFVRRVLAVGINHGPLKPGLSSIGTKDAVHRAQHFYAPLAELAFSFSRV